MLSTQMRTSAYYTKCLIYHVPEHGSCHGRFQWTETFYTVSFRVHGHHERDTLYCQYFQNWYNKREIQILACIQVFIFLHRLRQEFQYYLRNVLTIRPTLELNDVKGCVCVMLKKWFIDFINVTTNIFRCGKILSHYFLLPLYYFLL